VCIVCVAGARTIRENALADREFKARTARGSRDFAGDSQKLDDGAAAGRSRRKQGAQSTRIYTADTQRHI
jgi:hypothetical protein